MSVGVPRVDEKSLKQEDQSNSSHWLYPDHRPSKSCGESYLPSKAESGSEGRLVIQVGTWHLEARAESFERSSQDPPPFGSLLIRYFNSILRIWRIWSHLSNGGYEGSFKPPSTKVAQLGL